MRYGVVHRGFDGDCATVWSVECAVCSFAISGSCVNRSFDGDRAALGGWELFEVAEVFDTPTPTPGPPTPALVPGDVLFERHGVGVPHSGAPGPGTVVGSVRVAAGAALVEGDVAGSLAQGVHGP